ncbi:hypothetical protein ABBQ32_011920 [Trebouxia sp. C0010 RCD-2024]
MAVFDFEPKDGQLDEPLRSQEMIMLKEVLYVEEADKPSSPVVGLQRPAQSHDLVPLPSSLGSFEFNLPSHLEEHLSEVRERTPPYVELPAAKRQATLPVVLETAPSTESPLQSPFASAENIDRFLEDVPEQERAPQQLQQQLQQHRQHSAPAPLTLSRALLESQSQELSLQQICSSDEAKARVASLPTSKMLACSNMQVSLSPVVWRDFELPHRVMVNLGLRCIEMGGDSCYPASMYSAFNPRVITTGVPAKRQHPYRREATPTQMESRQTRKMTRSVSLGSNLVRSPCTAASPPVKKEPIELEVPFGTCASAVH